LQPLKNATAKDAKSAKEMRRKANLDGTPSTTEGSKNETAGERR
jgi:hypothetical protein